MRTLAWFAAALVIAAAWLWWQSRDEAPPARVQPQPRLATSERVVTVPVLAAPEPSKESLPIEHAATLQSRFAGERPDATWADSARGELDRDLARFASKDASVRAIECRSSLCRIEVSVANHDSASGFMESWLHQRTWTGPGSVTEHDGMLVMFVAKPGTELAED